jgi:hypothetical protein
VYAGGNAGRKWVCGGGGRTCGLDVPLALSLILDRVEDACWIGCFDVEVGEEKGRRGTLIVGYVLVYCYQIQSYSYSVKRIQRHVSEALKNAL